MKLPKLPYDPGSVIEFFQEGIEALGAVAERTWHDRLQLVAEGQSARLWREDGQLLETEIHFPVPDQAGVRDATKEVFPGCPLIFHLVDLLRPSGLVLQRAIMQSPERLTPPEPAIAEKLWHAQFPGALRWHLETEFHKAWHFSLLTTIRCEIQAIDQHWSLHRLVISLPDGARDDALASTLEFADFVAENSAPISWPGVNLELSQQLLARALTQELEPDLAAIRQRQENFLRRELERIDEYFDHYLRELTERLQRRHRPETKSKNEDRLAASKAEHERRRQDQVQRHEIRIIPHTDALWLLAEPAWQTRVAFTLHSQPQAQEAFYIPRARRWVVL